MSTLVAVCTPDKTIIAADTLSGHGEQRLTSEHHPASKIIQVGSSLIGIAGPSSSKLALVQYFSGLDEAPALGAVSEVFAAWLMLHAALRADYYLLSDANEDDPYESTRMDALVVNATGAYLVTADRSVDVVARYDAIGSGDLYALGALHALTSVPGIEPEEMAARAITAAAEFDVHTGLPYEIHTVTRDSVLQR